MKDDLSIDDLQEKLLQFEQMNSFVSIDRSNMEVKSETLECNFQARGGKVGLIKNC